MYAPLVAHMFREYGLLPCSVDSHIGEYVPFAKAVAGWHPVPVYFHEGVMARVERLVTRYGNGDSHVPWHKAGRSAEEVFPVIGAIWSGQARSINAVNVPNRGYVPNLPDGAIVEVPAVADGNGVVAPCRPSSSRWPSSCGPRSSCRNWWSTRPSRGPALAFDALRRDPALSPRRGVVPEDVRRTDGPAGRRPAVLTPGAAGRVRACRRWPDPTGRRPCRRRRRARNGGQVTAPSMSVRVQVVPLHWTTPPDPSLTAQ